MARTKAFDPEAVVDVAVEAFRDDGFEATTIAGLSARTGVGRQSLYDTFGDKQQLWARALVRYRQVQGDAMLGALEDDDVLVGIRAMLDWLVADSCADPRGCMVVAATAERVPSDAETTRQVTEQFGAIVEVLRLALRRGQALGQLDPDLDPAATAEMLLALVQGLRVVGKVRPDPARLAAAVDAALGPLAA